MKTDFIKNKLMEELKGRPITPADLQDFYRRNGEEVNEQTLAWRIFDLKKRKILSNLKKGVYTLEEKQLFMPPLEEEIIEIDRLLQVVYADQSFNIWDTQWLNTLTELQTTSSIIVVETEKEWVDDIFYFLQENQQNPVYIKPDKFVIEKYISETMQSVIVKPFISKSPVQLNDGIKTPTLEKILVDLFCDKHIYFAFQGHQLEIIYRNAFNRYHLNFSKLFTYATRRSREQEIKELLKKALGPDYKRIAA